MAVGQLHPITIAVDRQGYAALPARSPVIPEPMNSFADTSDLSRALQLADRHAHTIAPTHGAVLLPILRCLTGTAAALAAWLERRN